MTRPSFEQGNTVQFTFTSSVAPDSAPRFRVLNAADTTVDSMTAVQSTTTAYYAMFTMPNTPGPYIAEWLAVKTFNGSARNFYGLQPFDVRKTTVV